MKALLRSMVLSGQQALLAAERNARDSDDNDTVEALEAFHSDASDLIAKHYEVLGLSEAEMTALTVRPQAGGPKPPMPGS